MYWQLFILFGLFGDTAPRVENGVKPVSSWSPVLSEDLRVEPDVDHLWASNNEVVQVDKRGFMFVMDQRENRILEWDPQGRFVRFIGGTGEGPGEFSALVSFQIFPDQSALAFENQGAVSRFTLYDPGFVFRERKALPPLPQIPRFAVFSPDRKRIATTTTDVASDKNAEITEFLILGNQGDHWKTIQTLLSWKTMALDRKKLGDANHWIAFLSERFGVLAKGKDAYAVFDSQGNMFTALADSYQVTRWDSTLKKNLVFTRSYKPMPLSEAEIDEQTLPVRDAIRSILPPELQEIITLQVIRSAAEKAEFPSVKFPIAGLKPLVGGGLMVVHAVNALTGRGVGDLFDAKGHYRGSINIENNGIGAMIFNKEFAYTIENKDDEANLVRYRFSPGTAEVGTDQ